MTEDNKGSISLGLGILIGLGVAYLLFKIVSESQKQQQLSMQNLQATALLQNGYGLYGLSIPQPIQQPTQIQSPIQIPMQQLTEQQIPTSKYDNEESYHAVRDERGLLLDVKVKRNAKVR